MLNFVQNSYQCKNKINRLQFICMALKSMYPGGFLNYMNFDNKDNI